MKCGLPDVVQAGLLLAMIPKNQLAPCGISFIEVDGSKLLTWELVANRLIVEHKTLNFPKPGSKYLIQ
jgi:hypothetical protein